MKRFKRITEAWLIRFTAIIPFNFIRKWASKDFIIINYHSIHGWDPDPVINKNKYRTIDRLEQDLRFFNENYSVIKITDLINNKSLPQNALAITIDDGLKSVYDLMYPVFKKTGIKPALFVNPDFIDNTDLHFIRKRNIILKKLGSLDEEQHKNLISWLDKNDLNIYNLKIQLHSIKYHQRSVLDELIFELNLSVKDILDRKPVYLSSTEIDEMLSDGFELGAHSMDHPPFEQLSPVEQEQQVLESMKWIEEDFNTGHRMFAFPSDDRPINQKLFNNIRDFVDITLGVQGLQRDTIENHYHRITIESSGATAEQAIKYEYLKYILKRTFKKSIFKRKL
nr:polysaccharide deacetylase family protein [uncultured Carboxylicivirga sp.]